MNNRLAIRYFGCLTSISSCSATWLTRGLPQYITAQYGRKTYLNNKHLSGIAVIETKMRHPSQRQLTIIVPI